MEFLTGVSVIDAMDLASVLRTKRPPILDLDPNDIKEPRRDQPYQTMQLMQMNYYLTHGLLRFDAATSRLHVDYARYHPVVSELLREVLAVQDAGDKTASDRFIERWTSWDDTMHGALGRAMRATETSRFRLVRYSALGE